MGRSRRLKKVKDVHWKENTGVTEQLFTGRFQCDICKRFFLSKSTLERHYGTHSNGKALVCSRCGRLQPLLEFKIKLSKEIPLMSEVSGNCSKKESYLRCSSFQLKDWKYVCDVCKQSFVCETLFEMHYRKHIGKKSLYCASCSAGKEALKSSDPSHERDRRYICRIVSSNPGRTFDMTYGVDAHSVCRGTKSSFWHDVVIRKVEYHLGCRPSHLTVVQN
ncbi:hypothetical protein TNCV_851111 [Trichonephila clavipes]|nr:hypothetical protein TNCV_851111 [Trichonephila clavipes]